MKECNCKDCKCDVIKSQKEKYLKMFPNLKEDDVHVELVGDIVKDNVRYKTYKTTINKCNESGESIFIEDKKTIEIPMEKKEVYYEDYKPTMEFYNKLKLKYLDMFSCLSFDDVNVECVKTEVKGDKACFTFRTSINTDKKEKGIDYKFHLEDYDTIEVDVKEDVSKEYDLYADKAFPKIIDSVRKEREKWKELEEKYKDKMGSVDDFISDEVKEESETKKQTVENFVKEAKEKFIKELNEKFCVYSTRKISIDDIKCEKCSNGCMCIIDKSCNELDFSCNLKYSKFYEFPEELKHSNVKAEKKEEHDTVKDIESFWNPKTGNNTKDCEENYKAWLKLQRINVCEYLSELYPKYYFSTDDVDFRVILENKTKKAVRFEYDETFIGKRIYYSVIKDFDSEIDYVSKYDDYLKRNEERYRYDGKQWKDNVDIDEFVNKFFQRHHIDTFEDFLDFYCRW